MVKEDKSKYNKFRVTKKKVPLDMVDKKVKPKKWM